MEKLVQISQVYFMHIFFWAEPCVMNEFPKSILFRLGMQPSKSRLGEVRAEDLGRVATHPRGSFEPLQNPKIWGEASESWKKILEVFRFCAVHPWESWTCASVAKVLSAMIRSSPVSCFSVSFWWWASEFLHGAQFCLQHVKVENRILVLCFRALFVTTWFEL